MPWGDESLRSTKAIDQLFREGEVYHGKLALLIVRRVVEGPRQVLFVASRRVGKAVRRNRAKRLLREAHRRHAGMLEENAVHLVWIARRSCAESGMWEVWQEMADLLQRAGLMSQTQTHDRDPFDTRGAAD